MFYLQSSLCELFSGRDVEIRNVHTLHYPHNWYLFILSRMVDSWTVDTLQIFRDNIDTREPPVTLHGQIVLIHTLQDILDEAEATVRKRAWNSHFSGGLGRSCGLGLSRVFLIWRLIHSFVHSFFIQILTMYTICRPLSVFIQWNMYKLWWWFRKTSLEQ